MLLQHFIIIGKFDNLLYELDVNYSSNPTHTKQQVKQFLLHASLDTLDQVQYFSNQCYLKNNPIEKFHDSYVYAYVTSGNIRMLALCTETNDTSSTEHLIYGSSVSLHSSQSSNSSTSDSSKQQGERKKFEESLKLFFTDIHTAYVNLIMNPFYELNSPITSKVFDQHVREYYSKYLK